MTIRVSRLRWALLVGLLSLGGVLVSQPTKAITTPMIVQSALSTECLDYRVVGICVWLRCTAFGCSIRTSLKVRHYIPELVVSSYENTGENPWTEIAMVSPPLGNAMGGGQSTSDAEPNFHEHLRFKNVDAIGHPGTELFNHFASALGFTCSGAAQPFQPYFVSTLDAFAWRSGIPESAYPEALIPGRRELGQMGADLWGNIYPRSGFITQVHDYKAAALMAQRSADIVTRTGQPHVYQPLVSRARDGHWPPGPVVEGNSNHKWQHLSPKLSQSCVVWPDRGAGDTYADRLDSGGDYVFALWQRYRCCQRRGQTLLSHTGS
ncbi:TIGR03756 family integrating conjugative element protein [Billgrantia ethanolica]|uniref:TIGR03756 family integrating conjugative element protein n=1 Tax=Billgrantia ethanolica TaxID=2733486 RepID=A0ABS9AB68_9GAMM|nr:TIGR03756 family integrating conjugative element protein [Halomonas ethanolica]MCE8005295.1 TIGR03756 family integrating conjugative element protein [Halomonas ethanolica]